MRSSTNLFASRSTVNLDVTIYHSWHQLWREMKGIYTGNNVKNQEVTLIRLNQKAYNALIKKSNYLHRVNPHTFDKSDAAIADCHQHERDCDDLYIHIYKMLVMYSCPGQHVAFDVVLPLSILSRLDPRRLVQEYCNTCVVFNMEFNARTAYTVIKHPLHIIPGHTFGRNMLEWEENHDWRRELVLYVVSMIEKSQDSVVMFENHQNLPENLHVTRDSIMIASSEKRQANNNGRYAIGYLRGYGEIFVFCDTMYVELTQSQYDLADTPLGFSLQKAKDGSFYENSQTCEGRENQKWFVENCIAKHE